MSIPESTGISTGPLSRRHFLRTGCLGAAAVGLAVFGIGYVVTTPETTPIALPSFSFGDPNAGNRLLIAYASATGSTVQVATAIGEQLGTLGMNIDVKPIQANPAISGYQSVMLGSAVQFGAWLPEAVSFVKANQAVLARLPVALFSVHIQNLEDDESSRQKRNAYLDTVRPFVRPVQEAFFAGRFDRRGAVLLLPDVVGRFVPTMDYRDWTKIRAWPESVLPLLVQQT